jgi:proteasome alpha subunit
VDETGEHLFETDPSGALMEYKAGSIGAGRNGVMELFEEEYKDNFTLDKSINLGLRALDSATEGGLNAPAVEIATVTHDQTFQKMDTDKVLKYVETVLKKKK